MQIKGGQALHVGRAYDFAGAGCSSVKNGRLKMHDIYDATRGIHRS